MLGANSIFKHLVGLIMTGTIQFNNELCFGTIKICDIITQRFLSLKFDRIFIEKHIPKLSFMLGHVFS